MDAELLPAPNSTRELLSLTATLSLDAIEDESTWTFCAP